MTKWRIFTVLLAFCLLPALPVRAAQAGVTIAVQDGYTCDYGVDIPFTRSPRTGSYTFSLYPGESVSGVPEVTAEVTITSTEQVKVHLPLRYDIAAPSTWTLSVTAHVAPGREGFDKEATATKTFTTTPTCGCAAGTAGAYYAGDGTTYPYLIVSQAQLAHMQSHLDAGLRLENDLTLSGSWSSVGTFTGVFDGGGHTIEGLSSTTGGLFSAVSGNGAEIKNVTLFDPDIHYSSKATTVYGGCIANTVENAHISDCTVSNVNIYVSGTDACPAGIAGKVTRSSIMRCKVTGTIGGYGSRNLYQGGIASINVDSSFIDCLSSASLTGSAASPVYYGGIVGAQSGFTSPIILQNCHWTAPSWAVGRSGAHGGDFTPNTGDSFGNSQVHSIE